MAAARGLVTLAEGSRAEIVVTHGNGPQVGFLAIGAEMAASVVPAPPLDVLGAETQGQIGYLLAQALNDAFLERGRHRQMAVIVTRTVVPADDPAFANPTKPVGPIYDEATASEHAATRGWRHRARRQELAARRSVAAADPDRRSGGHSLARGLRHARGRVRGRGSARSSSCRTADTRASRP